MAYRDNVTYFHWKICLVLYNNTWKVWEVQPSSVGLLKVRSDIYKAIFSCVKLCFVRTHCGQFYDPESSFFNDFAAMCYANSKTFKRFFQFYSLPFLHASVEVIRTT